MIEIGEDGVLGGLDNAAISTFVCAALLADMLRLEHISDPRRRGDCGRHINE
jgi:hypothetical protein